ncbi:PINIT domain-containing protein [Umbelopsis sp. AD052]|nr:PINIT domain-containing protein [Umbelopsis sp. AD052]
MINNSTAWTGQSAANRRTVEQLDMASLKVAQIKDIVKEFNELKANGQKWPRITLAGNKLELIGKVQNRLLSVTQHPTSEAFPDHMAIVQRYVDHTSQRSSHRSTAAPSTKATPYAAVVLPVRQDQSSSQIRSHGSHYTWWDQVKFKDSPFYEPIDRVSTPKMCIEARDMRSSVSMDIQLTDAQRAALRGPKDESGQVTQLRFFCTAADSFNSKLPALMEYPPICELKVNGQIVGGSLRGLKNKPGTVNPPNITPLVQLSQARNHVELVYANTQKRYAAAVMIVKARSVESIVEQIKSTRYVTKEDVLQRIRARNADSDIVVGSSAVSIKCPLGFIRIKLPCRSRLCQHIQCFDAFTFFHMNEQTPTWTCPVCTNIIHSWEELVIDGYFSDILANTPKEQDSIIIEENGEWRLAKDPSATSLSASPPPSSHKRSVSAMRDNTPATSQTEDVTVIDDEDDMRPTPVSSTRSAGSPVSQRSGKKQRVMEVIDLTLSSDEEDEAVEEQKEFVPTEDFSTEEAPVKSESTQEIPVVATSNVSNGYTSAPILPIPTTYHINNEHTAYGSTSWSGSHPTIATIDNTQSGIDRPPLWLPPLRNGSGSPRQYQSPLRNLSPLSTTSSHLSSNYDPSNSIPPVSRLVLDSWNGYNSDRENN